MITANRSLYVDFTIPYTDLGVGTVARDGHNQRNMWWFLEPLDTSMWVTATCSFFVIGVTIWLIEYPINTKFQGPWQDVVGSVLWFSFSTLTFSEAMFIGVIINNSNFKDPSLIPHNSLDEYARALSEESKKGSVAAIMDEYPYMKLFLAKYGSPYHLDAYEPNTNGLAL